MKRIPANLIRNVCLIAFVGCLGRFSVSQTPPPNEIKTLDNPGGGKVLYGPLAAQSSLNDGIVLALRNIQTHFGDHPQVDTVLTSSNGDSLAAFFTVTAKNDEDKPIAGLVIVAASPGITTQSAILYDEADRFASNEPDLLRLLAPSARTPAATAAIAPGGIAPLHLASGGDKSASICLPADWNITQVSSGALTAKGPHSEMVALGFMQMVLDPTSAEARRQVKSNTLSNLPRAKFPDKENQFTTFIDVLNQLRATNKLPPATFTLISSKNLPLIAGKLPPIEVIFNLDLADGVGPRKASARIEVLQYLHMPDWGLIVSTSSVPVAYATSEEATLLAIIRSFREEMPVVSRIETLHGPGGDPGHWDPERKGYVLGRGVDPHNCSAIGGPAPNIGWPRKVAESFILDPSADESSEDSPQTDITTKLSNWLMKSHPDFFTAQQMKQPQDNNQDQQ
jgi:hypothetical protein